MKRFRTSYLVTEGIRGIFLNPFMSFAAITIIAACLVIMGSFTLVAFNVNRFVVTLEQTNRVVAYIDETLSPEEAKSVHTKINQLDNIDDNRYVSKEEALATFSKNDPTLTEGLKGSDNPLRNRCVVTLTDITQQSDTVRQISAVPGVAKVDSDEKIRNILESAHSIVNVISIFLILLLSVVSVFIVANTIKLATYDRREEIAIMRMVGATRGFIRFPFFVEGALIGLVGGLLAFFVQWIVYSALAKGITINLISVPIAPFAEVQFKVLAVFILGGLLAGSLGSVLTIRRFLKV